LKLSLEWMNDFAGFGSSPGVETLAETASEIGLEIALIERLRPGSSGPDTVFDADITPNRPDAMNHRGFARDLAAALELAFDNGRLAPSIREKGGPIEEIARVSIEVPDQCHRFALRSIRNCARRPSSERWARRMENLGLKLIESRVDATNISLWGIGQPLHAFDAGRVAGGHLIIRHARRGEKLLCLDGVERELHPEDVVVADEKRPLSLAGVIGGVDSAISESTTDVLLEAAWWDPVSIRRTARRHGLHTDASHRYERGADIEAIPEGLALAASLILEAAGGELSRGMIDEYPRPFVARAVRLRHSRLLALSGLVDFPLDRAAGILERLGFAVNRGDRELEARVPSWRPDISIEEDLVEEVVRIHGYSKIPSTLPPADRLAPLFLSAGSLFEVSPRESEDLVADQAREAGLFETMIFPFVPSGAASNQPENFLSKENFRSEPFLVANPLDATRPALRRLLLPGLLEAVSLNHRNGRRSIGLFETGRVWDRPTPPGADPAEAESRHFAAVIAGTAPDEWPERPVDILDAKGVAERILTAATGGIPDFRPVSHAAFEELSALEIRIGGRRGGIVGRLAEEARRDLPLPSNTIVMELDLGALPREKPGAHFREYSRFPAVEIDVTFPAPVGDSWRSMVKAIDEAGLADREEASLVGLYPDPKRPGTRNVTVKLRFRAPDRTLAQDEVNRERDRLLDQLKEKLGETR
jgi:phenylalanyl-tRNA synthetase beta chain